jgi:hypothetical protein
VPHAREYWQILQYPIQREDPKLCGKMVRLPLTLSQFRALVGSPQAFAGTDARDSRAAGVDLSQSARTSTGPLPVLLSDPSDREKFLTILKVSLND